MLVGSTLRASKHGKIGGISNKIFFLAGLLKSLSLGCVNAMNEEIKLLAHRDT